MNWEQLSRDIKRAYMTPHKAWTYFFIFQLIMLGILITYKYVLPKSVCVCYENKEYNNTISGGFGERLNLIKLRDFGDCETISQDYNCDWTGKEIPLEEFLEDYRQAQKGYANFSNIIVNYTTLKTIGGVND